MKRQRHKAEEAGIARKKALVARLEDAFKSDFLSAGGVLAADSDAELVSGEEFSELKTRFVRDWAARELQQQLDFEQAAAVAATVSDIQVVTRAVAERRGRSAREPMPPGIRKPSISGSWSIL